MTDTPNPPEGWYPDPAGSGDLRRWNGAGWTEEVRSASSAPDTGSVDAAPGASVTDQDSASGDDAVGYDSAAEHGGSAPGDSAAEHGDSAPGDSAPPAPAPADAAAPTTDARRDATAAWDTAAEDAAGEYDGGGEPLSRADRTVPVAAPPAPPAPPAYSSAPFVAGAATGAAAGAHAHDTAASPAAYPAYPGAPAAPSAAPVARRDISTDTIWIWLVVALPLLTVLSLFLFDWRTFIDESVYSSLYPEAAPRMVSSTVGVTLGFTALSLVLTGLTVLFSFLDWRELRSRGVERPFHWAWSFFLLLISTNGVYVIGRGVILRRQTGKGLGPVWAWIAVTVVSIVIASVWALILVGYLFELLDRSGLLY